MRDRSATIISYSFLTLFFSVPLILHPSTSELFEFNKMIAVYLLTTVILLFWAYRMIQYKTFIFKRSSLDIPIVIFLVSQLISTIVSVDTRTSLLGYYSRYHGGLVSSICYSLLYWAFVSNITRKAAINTIKATIASAILVCTYAVLEHFGIDKDVWIQDVQSRVFSTLGQPNWLAAWVITLIPISWSFIIQSLKNKSNKKFIAVWMTVQILLFVTLLFTKSRSGLLGFIAAFSVYWGLLSWQQKANLRQLIKPLSIISTTIITTALVIGTQFTPSISQMLTKSVTPNLTDIQKVDDRPDYVPPALEVAGSESGTIRKIVWKGAIDIWKHYPVFGSGVETFAFSYYLFRPIEHNLVSEWDFLYNKAHNEYLNYMATTGTFGIFAYGLLITATLIVIYKKSNDRLGQSNLSSEFNYLIKIGLLSGYVSILVTNFFGFSVVPVALQFFLFPAFAVTLVSPESKILNQKNELSGYQILALTILIFSTFYLLLATGRYWYADYLFNKGAAFNSIGNPISAINYLDEAIKLSPNEAVFWMERSDSNLSISLAYAGGDIDSSGEDGGNLYTQNAIRDAQSAEKLSPANVNIKRRIANMYLKLSIYDINYLVSAINNLEDAIVLAPTEAKLMYNLGLAYAKADQIPKAIELLEKTIQMRPHYVSARLTLAIAYDELKEYDKEKQQLEYVLSIDPNQPEALRMLAELEGK